jgi:TPR repeat protein
MNNYAPAIRLYKYGLSISSNFYELWNNLGNAYCADGKYEKAIVSFDKAIEGDPKYGDALYGKARTLNFMGAYNEALELCSRTLELYNDKRMKDLKKDLTKKLSSASVKNKEVEKSKTTKNRTTTSNYKSQKSDTWKNVDYFETAEKYMYGKDGFEMDHVKAVILYIKAAKNNKLAYKKLESIRDSGMLASLLENIHKYGLKIPGWFNEKDIAEFDFTIPFDCPENNLPLIKESKQHSTQKHDKDKFLPSGVACFLTPRCNLQKSDDKWGIPYDQTRISEVDYIRMMNAVDKKIDELVPFNIQLLMQMPEVQSAYDMYLIAEYLFQMDSKEFKKPAFEIFSIVSSNIPEAQLKMGDFYEFVFDDFEKAVKMYKKAAKNGLPEAQFRYANMLMIGKGVNVNQKKAFIWYEKAAAQGVPEAQFVLGEFYRSGNVIKRDLKKAKKWYNVSLKNGFNPAEQRLKQTEESF